MTITDCTICGESIPNDLDACFVCGSEQRATLLCVDRRGLRKIVQEVRQYDALERYKFVKTSMDLSRAIEEMRASCNDLLRSIYQVALREGEETNWEAVKAALQKELLAQAHKDGATDEQTILRATCTPRTYRMTTKFVAGTDGTMPRLFNIL